nr:hypothetical protein [Methylomarinum sp. Ch1-1]MDP4522031.1 hypothetical protein [Methylomarinum sp. Ch1-1]
MAVVRIQADCPAANPLYGCDANVALPSKDVLNNVKRIKKRGVALSLMRMAYKPRPAQDPLRYDSCRAPVLFRLNMTVVYDTLERRGVHIFILPGVFVVNFLLCHSFI